MSVSPTNSDDPEQWQQGDVVRCVRWVSRTFSVPAPRRHLLPPCGPALLALTEDNWLQVCGGNSQAARIFHAYMQHTHATAKGRPPPPPLPEHQAPSNTVPEQLFLKTQKILQLRKKIS
ncbi:unnamed protein product [Euphydryas editha]|uniref:Uncharacterized protein n=1 Tax=Euphydryas editha TaxID=104508 RepID=A0AAU9VCE6_EUPED|nr:unnamed protein product [Euphydryas editha]